MSMASGSDTYLFPCGIQSAKRASRGALLKPVYVPNRAHAPNRAPVGSWYSSARAIVAAATAPMAAAPLRMWSLLYLSANQPAGRAASICKYEDHKVLEAQTKA